MCSNCDWDAPAETLRDKLQRLGACREAIDWVGERDLETAWRECNRADWMAWLCLKMLNKPGWPGKDQLTAALARVFDDALRYASVLAMGTVWFESSRAEHLQARWADILRDRLSVPKELMV